MKRRLLTILAVVSLLLCVATIALWIRAYRVGDWAKWDRRQSYGRATPDEHGIVSMHELAETATIYCVETYDGGIGLGRSYDGLEWYEGPTPVGSLVPIRHYQSFSFGHNDLATLSFFYPRRHRFFPGFDLSSAHNRTVLNVPLWFIVLLTILLPSQRIVTCFLDRRRRPGICAHCGYDLRATPDRCPECGTVPMGAAK